MLGVGGERAAEGWSFATTASLALSALVLEDRDSWLR
jgi:hypothetical protein